MQQKGNQALRSGGGFHSGRDSKREALAKEWWRELADAGLCIYCGTELIPGDRDHWSYCPNCRPSDNTAPVHRDKIMEIKKERDEYRRRLDAPGGGNS